MTYSLGGTENTCTSCSGCTECSTSTGVCPSCNAGYKLVDEKCIECGEMTYSTGGTVSTCTTCSSSCSICDYTNGKYVKYNVLLLDDEFINEHPEASVYFEEKIVNGKWYQLRITEKGVNELFDYIVHVLGKELF